jgi:hypothetical protein
MAKSSPAAQQPGRLATAGEHANRARAWRLVGSSAVPRRRQWRANASRGSTNDVDDARHPRAAVSRGGTEAHADPGRKTGFGAKALESRTTMGITWITQICQSAHTYVVALCRQRAATGRPGPTAVNAVATRVGIGARQTGSGARHGWARHALNHRHSPDKASADDGLLDEVSPGLVHQRTPPFTRRRTILIQTPRRGQRSTTLNADLRTRRFVPSGPGHAGAPSERRFRSGATARVFWEPATPCWSVRRREQAAAGWGTGA